ncbi:MAG TPA: cobyrinic acid a,c-diamide synthase, partial [Bacillales bacterium]|nr:cobyrinic acid a,c-diamide synthase [Bacillales bacterium]
TSGLPFIAGGSGLSEVFEMDEDKKSHFFRQLEELESTYDAVIFDMGAGVTNDLLNFILASDEVFVVTTPEPTAVTDAYAALKFVSRKSDGALDVRMIVNRCKSEMEGKETARRLANVAGRFLDQKIDAFHIVPDDPVVSNAVKAGVPFMLYSPKAAVSRSIREIAEEWCGLQGREGGFLRKLKTYFHFGKERAL